VLHGIGWVVLACTGARRPVVNQAAAGAAWHQAQRQGWQAQLEPHAQGVGCGFGWA